MPTASRTPRRAFSVFQLLIILAVLGILIGLLLPMIQRIREAAARTQCVHNAKQIALSIHNLHDTYRKLPALRYAVNAQPADQHNGNWHLMLLPFIEEANVYKSALAKLDAPQDSPLADGKLVRAYAPKVYLCPVDVSIKDGFPVNRKAGNEEWAATSYAANYQVFGTVKSGDALRPRYKLGTIPDGTSNTIFLAEVYGGGQKDEASLWAWNNTEKWGQYPAFAITGYGDSKKLPQFGVPTDKYDHSRAGSWHPRAVVIGLGDGSVRTIMPALTQPTWENACSPDDGNVLGADWVD